MTKIFQLLIANFTRFKYSRQMDGLKNALDSDALILLILNSLHYLISFDINA